MRGRTGAPSTRSGLFSMGPGVRTHWFSSLLIVATLGGAFGCGGAQPTPSAPESELPQEPKSPATAEPEVAQKPPSETPAFEEPEPAPAKASEPSAPPLPRGTKVLHVGDSFAGALGLPLGKMFEEAGVGSVLKFTDASYLTDWAWDGNLQKHIWKYNPDLVLITLGANELEIQDPESRGKTIKKMIEAIGDRPCVWIAIPLWAGPKNGLLDVIARNVSPCLFLDTNQLMDVENMPRIRDGIHPTESARKQWAEVVLNWLKAHREDGAERPWALRP